VNSRCRGPREIVCRIVQQTGTRVVYRVGYIWRAGGLIRTTGEVEDITTELSPPCAPRPRKEKQKKMSSNSFDLIEANRPNVQEREHDIWRKMLKRWGYPWMVARPQTVWKSQTILAKPTWRDLYTAPRRVGSAHCSAKMGLQHFRFWMHLEELLAASVQFMNLPHGRLSACTAGFTYASPPRAQDCQSGPTTKTLGMVPRRS